MGDQLVVPIGLHPAEVDVIVTLEDLEEVDAIATAYVIATLVGVVTMSDLEMMVLLTGVEVRRVVEKADLNLEMSDLERTDPETTDPEKDQLANQMTAGPKSSVNPSFHQTLFGGEFLSSVTNSTLKV